MGKIINIGSAANDGTGDTLRAAFAKVNENFNGAVAQRSAPGVSDVVLIIEGDSKGDEAYLAMKWVAARRGMPLGTWVNINRNASNSSSGPNGLTESSRMAASLAIIKARTDAGQVCDLVYRGWTNDGGFSAATSFANFLKWYQSVFIPSGARFLWLLSPEMMNSDDGGTAAANGVRLALGEMARAWALKQAEQVIYIDIWAVMLDGSAANDKLRAIPHTFNGSGTPPPGAMLADGIHGTDDKVYATRSAFVGPMERVFPRGYQLPLARNFGYTAAIRHGNMTGPASRTVALGTDAYNLMTVEGGTKPALWPAGHALTGTFTGTSNITFATSSITITEDNGPIARGTHATVSFTVSGTTGSSGSSMTLGQFAYGLGQTIAVGTPISFGSLMYFDTSVGLGSVDVTPDATRIKLPKTYDYLYGPTAESVTGPVMLRLGPQPVTQTFDAAAAGLTFRWRGNTAISGTIHVLVSSWMQRHDAIPPSA